MREVDHDAALRRAIARTTLFDDAERSRTITGKARHRVVETSASASLRATHGAEFDAWARARDAHVSVDRAHAGDGGRPLLRRVLTKLGACDGVTALRVALHALEIVEGGNEAMTESAFKQNPTYRYGARQAFNFVRRVLFETAVDVVGYKLGLGYGRKNARQAPEYDGVRAPNTPKALFDLYAEGGAGDAPVPRVQTGTPERISPSHRGFERVGARRRTQGILLSVKLQPARGAGVPDVGGRRRGSRPARGTARRSITSPRRPPVRSGTYKPRFCCARSSSTTTADTRTRSGRSFADSSGIGCASRRRAAAPDEASRSTASSACGLAV